ncbi:DNA-binding protein [Candidatus Leptofilum sp.]|uniref:helix-turn-helix domain-containing transcriptional regulator n=1 Tax=Candidatus Leptofilum sp. TaxID=3241576 RepID=UPI003B5941D2
MTVVRDVKDTIQERAQNDEEFATALLDEAIALFLNGEPESARILLRDLVNSTVGFEELAVEVDKPSKSLHRMLSARGNPTMDNLTKIFTVLQQKLNVDFEIRAVKQV